MTPEKTPLGHIYISPRAIATVAYQAVLESYGVVGLAPRNIVDGLAHTLVHDPTQGVVVDYDGEAVTIDLYIVVEYGTRIKAVANSVANAVRYKVEKQVGVPVREVNVHVRGLRMSEESPTERDA